MGKVAFNKIMVPIDYSENCKKSVEYAVELGRVFHSTLYLVHVISADDIEAIEKASKLMIDTNCDMLVEERKKFELEELEKFFPPDDARGLEVRYFISTGKPYNQIVRKAKKREMDLIVICTHGRSNLPYVLFGSVAERVIRKAHCPVLVVQACDNDNPDELCAKNSNKL